MISDRPVDPPADMKALLRSVLQDFGEIPPEYLVPAGPGGHLTAAPAGLPGEGTGGNEMNESGVYLYDEWDFRRRYYRKNWCALRELQAHPSDEPLAARTLAKYAGLVRELKRTFEALRGEDSLLRKQRSGDDIDLDAVVGSYADSRAGTEPSDRLFTRKRKLERDMAVVFMVYMSGSTKGRINEAERESLILLCEALELLGDRYSIFGFPE